MRTQGSSPAAGATAQVLAVAEILAAAGMPSRSGAGPATGEAAVPAVSFGPSLANDEMLGMNVLFLLSYRPTDSKVR